VLGDRCSVFGQESSRSSSRCCSAANIADLSRIAVKQQATAAAAASAGLQLMRMMTFCVFVRRIAMCGAASEEILSGAGVG
jgi:hypothetical protein